MKYFIIAILSILLIGCSPSPVMDYGTTTEDYTKWFDTGYQDAHTGNMIKDNDTLAEWYGVTEINRPAYLEGYTQGQLDLCQPGNITVMAQSNQPYPDSCGSVPKAEMLKNLWQTHQMTTK